MIATADSIAPPALHQPRSGQVCAHCGEPIAPAMDPLRDDDGRPYCCSGCRAVRAMLQQCGLDSYYQRRAASGAPTVPRGSEDPRPHAEFDAPEFLARHAVQMASDRWRVELRLDGLRCGACVWLLESLPRLAEGVFEVRVDAGRSVVAIDWSPAQTTLSRVATWIERLGYRLLPLRDRRQRELDRREDRAWLVRLGMAAVLSANSMGIAFALYGGWFHGMDASMRLDLQWISMALGAASVLGPGRLFLRNAWLALRARTPHMDLPISLALVAAIGGGVWSTWRGGHGVYAESICMLVLLLLAGRFVQFRTQLRARHQVDLLATLIPGVARRMRRPGRDRPPADADGDTGDGRARDPGAPDESFEEVPLEAILPGDVLLIPAGECAGADGRLLDAARWVDMQALTGESRPVRCEVGSILHAGCRVLDAPALMEVIVAGEMTRAGRLMAMVDEAASRRAPVVQFAHRIAGWFLAAVLLLAAATLALWWRSGVPIAIEHMVALLVVTCPCALGLATPLTMVASIAKAARAGMLVKGGEVIERLARPGTIVLDKTGTITEGRMRLTECHGDAVAIGLAAVLESRSAHPVARAIAEFPAAELGADGREAPARLEVSDVRETAGRGIEGVVGNHRVAVGRRSFVARDDADAREWVRLEHELTMRGHTPVAISVDARIRAMVGVGDPIRSEAADTVRALRRRGWRVVMASGDDARVAAGVGAAIGLDAAEIHGECTPEQKHALIVSGGLRRPVVMVGDGVNDVVAMAAADVGVSLGGGTRASLEVGDACLARDGVGALIPLLDGSARTLRVVHTNFAVGLAYNLIGASLAMAGVMNPLIAAIVMPLSGIMVTTIALRATRYDSAGSWIFAARAHAGDRAVRARSARSRPGRDPTLEAGCGTPSRGIR